MSKDLAEIKQKILASKKYKSIYPKTVERIVNDLSAKYKPKELEKEVKNMLHKVWGAYYSTRPDFSKLLKNFKEAGSWKQEVMNLLKIHSSTNERTSYLETFYKEIFEVTGVPTLIIDHGCGFNPLTLPWMNLPQTSTYKAYDIDTEEVEFLNNILGQLNISNAQVQLGDLLSDSFEYADVVFMFKILQVLDMQKKGSALNVLKDQKCKFIVVSFPTKSISGKDKGMKNFYESYLLDLIKDENWEVSKVVFDNDLVFIINKNPL